MIKLENVTKKYDSTVALDSFSLDIHEGDVCVLVGPSGCGKSTSLKMINRMLEPTDGSIFVMGRNVTDFQPEILRRQMGYVIQSIGLFPHMTVAENVGLVPGLLEWDRKKIALRVKELVSLVGLEPEQYLEKYPRELSGGEAQRVGVARALAADPDILLMDEPFGAVDPINRDNLHTQFIKIQRELKKTVVFVTHYIDEAIRLADRIAVMKAGRLVQYDTPEKILSAPSDSFVRDFVGADRTLKLLQRFFVRSLMRPAVSTSGTEGMDIDNLEELTVKQDDSLEEALSKMLGSRLKKMTVADDNQKVMGEVWLEDIEKVAYKGDLL